MCDARPEGDRADLHALAVLLARRWSPMVAISGDDGLLLDLTGVAHLHGGEARMAARLVRLLARLRLHRARRGRRYRRRGLGAGAVRGWRASTRPARMSTAIAPLPVAALRIDARAVELLQRLGIERSAR